MTRIIAFIHRLGKRIERPTLRESISLMKLISYMFLCRIVSKRELMRQTDHLQNQQLMQPVICLQPRYRWGQLILLYTWQWPHIVQSKGLYPSLQKDNCTAMNTLITSPQKATYPHENGFEALIMNISSSFFSRQGNRAGSFAVVCFLGRICNNLGLLTRCGVYVQRLSSKVNYAVLANLFDADVCPSLILLGSVCFVAMVSFILLSMTS